MQPYSILGSEAEPWVSMTIADIIPCLMLFDYSYLSAIHSQRDADDAKAVFSLKYSVLRKRITVNRHPWQQEPAPLP